MNRVEHSWHSERLGREMKLARYGDFGVPLLLFPTAGGDHLDNERFKLIHVLTPFIEDKRIKVYACSSVSKDAWCDSEAAPWHKSWLQARFDDYLQHELLPAISEDSGGVRGFIAAGASLGAFNAVTVAAKHPEWFSLVVAMSGTYDFDRWMGTHRDENYYFNQPLYFLPRLPDGPQKEALRKVHFVLASGAGRAEAPWESERLAALLRAHGVNVNLELWGADAHHDWPAWRTMLPLFLGKLLP